MAARRGVVVVLVLILVAVAISTAGLLFMGFAVGRGPQISSNSTLLIDVSGGLQETEPGGLGAFLEAPPTVRSIVDALRKASVDRRVSSVIIRPTSNAALWGKVQEVRDAIVDFKRSKKPIVAYLEYGGDQSYYLASACDKVFLMPTASLDLTGMANYEVFLRGALDKLGAFPDALHVGDYKTASNTFTEHSFTPAHREMAESLNTDLYEQLIAGLAEGRHRTPAEMSATLVDHGPYLPEDAVRAGLIDDLAYEDEIDDKVELGRGRTKTLRQHEYRERRPRLARTEPRAEDRPDLRRRHHQLRRQLRFGGRAGARLRHHGRVPAQGARGQLDSRHRAADRQPRRIGRRVGRHLARDHADAREEAGHRVDVRRRGLGRLLHRDAGPRHRRAAGHAHRIDWRRAGEVRDRRHARQAGHQPGDGHARALRRSRSRRSGRSRPTSGRRFWS